MPPVIAAIGALASSAMASGIAMKIAMSVALSVVTSMLTPKPKLPSTNSTFSTQSRGRSEMVRASVAPRRGIYGRVVLSGQVDYVESTGSNNDDLWLVMVWAAHQCNKINQRVFLDDQEMDRTDLANPENATGFYAGKATMYDHLGAAGQVADAALVAASDSIWTTDHVGVGICNSVFLFNYDDDIYPSGIPKPLADVEGALLYDPRDAGTRYSENPVLAIRDYMITHSKDVVSGDFDDTVNNASANVCDEFVAVVEEGAEFTADADDDFLTLATKIKGLRHGNRFQLTTTDTLPAGLSLSTNYYWIELTHDTGQVASSYANALAHTAIDITDAGTGTHTITRNAEVRYAVAATFLYDEDAGDVIDRLLSSMAGTITWVGGKYRIHAGAAVASAITLTADDLAGTLVIQPRRSRHELFNSVKPVFVDPYSNNSPQTAAPLTNATYETQDGGVRIQKVVQYMATPSSSMAQRLGKIELERGRQAITVNFPAKPTMMRLQVWDTVGITLADYGWTDKKFRVTNMQFNTALGVDLSLREEADAMWSWSAEETLQDLAPNTSLPSPFDTVSPPTSLALASGTAQLDTRLDGTIFSRINASWTAPTDGFVLNGGKIELQYKRSADGTWLSAPAIDPAITESFLLDVADGVSYDVRVRSVNVVGRRSAWDTVSNHTVLGKSALPSDVAAFSGQQNDNVVTFKWDAITDLDRTGYEIRYMAASFVWENATVLSRETKGTLVTNAGLPPGTWVCGIKAIDTSENYSLNATTFTITVTNTNDIVVSQASNPDWYDARWPTLEYIFTDGESPHLPGLTVARAGTVATRMGPTGLIAAVAANVARLDYDTSGNALGILIEEARTNRITEPRDFTNAAYDTVTNITALKDAMGVGGAANSASTLTADAGNGVIRQSIVLGSAARTTSVYVRRKTGTGTIEITDDGGSNYTDITSSLSASAWYRASITRTQANPDVGFRIVTSGDEIEVDVLQVEEGSFATSAIFSQATRPADDVSATVAWYNEDEGSFVVKSKSSADPGTDYIFAINDGSTNNQHALLIGATDWQYVARSGSAEVADLTGDALAANTEKIHAIAYNLNDFAMSEDGDAVVTDSVGAVPASLTVLEIGSATGSDNFLNGHISYLAYCPRRLLNDTLVAIAGLSNLTYQTLRQQIGHMLYHGTSGHILPVSQTLADDMTDAQLWDQMCYNPFTTYDYEADEIDLGFDANGVRVWGAIAATVGPGESGAADPILRVDYRDAADAYDGFEDWPGVGIADFRYEKGRAKFTSATGVAYMTAFIQTLDVAERTETGESVTVAIGGTTITFAEEFHGTPNIQLTAQSATAVFPVYTLPTSTGFKAWVYNAAGADVGGTVDWSATGA
jgi:hypothetical protein